jgi:hypothetical protein
MKKCLLVVALILASLCARTVAADSSHAEQDQAFLNQLAQQANEPMTPAAAEAPLKLAPSRVLCNQTSCRFDSDCDVACPGGGYCQNNGLYKRCNYI